MQLSRLAPSVPFLPPVPFFQGKKAGGSSKVSAPLQPDLFAPRQNPPGHNRFAVIGDPGSGTSHQWKIAEQMTRLHRQNPFASVLVLGDNVYEDGEPHLFKERIYQPYEDLFKQGVRFYPVLGNHDVRQGHGEAQLAYWGAPRYYNFKLGESVECFALDTTVYLPAYDKCYQDNPFFAKKVAEMQTQWLKEALSSSQAKYKVVFGHYPLYTSGKHSTDGNTLLRLREMLEPILAENGVKLYLAGHDHHYERSKVIQGIQHFVSGAAGRIRDIFHKDTPTYPREKALQKFHFMVFEETPEGLRFEVLSRRGKVLDAGTVSPVAVQEAPQVQFA